MLAIYAQFCGYGARAVDLTQKLKVHPGLRLPISDGLRRKYGMGIGMRYLSSIHAREFRLFIRQNISYRHFVSAMTKGNESWELSIEGTQDGGRTSLLDKRSIFR
ncbi:hypothetical protein SISNIDRAFT_458862 [Sistotremastrum niveocremeum HHB9708]|uniref:Uncharacterized protein n=1 Tax=Sistotremastrum niveocremeum HHB9708 TaxID=1314777 RepID=A0A164Q657_9AGAM|nr:hypothetical protein SISNIDRAFT_458862 [Sistotremastrum niveocremeum HHB9708]